MSDNTMCYVAADPKQPGAAWAICVDNPKHRVDTLKNIVEWERQGANVQLVGIEEGKAMLMKWVRPAKARKARRAR